MARYRRYNRFRRPVRKFRRRRVTLRRWRRYKQRSGDLHVKLIKRDNIDVKRSDLFARSLSFIMADFQEYAKLAPNFEYCKLKKVRVTIRPSMNVSNNSTSEQATYCMLPYHRPANNATSYEAYLSSDKAKIFRNTQIGRQTYVPNVHVANATSTPNATTDTLIWRPSIYTIKAQTSSPRIYTGIVAFDIVKTGDNETNGYDIFTELWVTFKNQQLLADV